MIEKQYFLFRKRDLYNQVQDKWIKKEDFGEGIAVLTEDSNWSLEEAKDYGRCSEIV